MLTSLNFLRPGQTWPPESERKRLDMYYNNKELFNNEHAEVYKEAFKRIERVVGNFKEIICYPVIINYQKLISLKIADLLLGEPPKITAGETGSNEQKTVDNIIDTTDLVNTSYQIAIDVSRYGDGLFYIYKSEKGGIIGITQPPIWFPVAENDSVKRIQHHVLAWQYDVGKNRHLKCQVHSKGYYEEHEYILKEGIIDSEITKSYKKVFTGINDFAVIQVSNLITSDTHTGYDDYTDIDSIMSSLMVRIGQINRILDKHANPSVEGSLSSLEQDPDTGEWRLKMGNFFAKGSRDEPETRYITWDGHLEANFRMIELLINQLYTVSEMGSAIFGDLTQKQGQIPSGSALRRLMISALAKVNRIRMRFDNALKKSIKLCSQLGGSGIVNLKDVPISITWQDGLPGDPKEESEIMQSRTQKPTMSVKRALQQYDSMSEEDADSEIQLIDEDETKVNPLNVPTFDNNTDGE